MSSILDNGKYVRSIKSEFRPSARVGATRAYLDNIKVIREKKEFVYKYLEPVKEKLTKEGYSFLIKSYLAYDKLPKFSSIEEFIEIFGEQEKDDIKRFGRIKIFNV